MPLLLMIFLRYTVLPCTTTSLYTDCSNNLYAGSPSYLLILFSALSAFAVGGLSIERNQKPLAPEITLAVTHHDRQKQVEVKRSSRVNPHEIRLFSGCPYAVVKQGTKNLQKNKPYKGFSRFRTDLSLVGLTCALYVLFLIVIMLHGHPFCYAAD